MQMWVKDIDITQRNDREAIEIWLEPVRGVWCTDVVFQNVIPRFEEQSYLRTREPAQLVTHGICDRIGHTLFRPRDFRSNHCLAWYQLDTTDDYAEFDDEFLGYPREISLSCDSDFWNMVLRVALMHSTPPRGDEICIKCTQDGNGMLANIRAMDRKWHLELNKEAADYCKDKEDWKLFIKGMEGLWSEIPS